MHAAIMLFYCVYCVLLFNKRILHLYHCAFAYVHKCGKYSDIGAFDLISSAGLQISIGQKLTNPVQHQHLAESPWASRHLVLS